MMRAIAGLVLLGACVGLAVGSAQAYLVEVTTSVEIDGTGDQQELGDALEAAVNNVLHDAIAFRPTLVVLTHARVVGQRLWVRMLVADQDGEAIFNELQDGPDPITAPAGYLEI